MCLNLKCMKNRLVANLFWIGLLVSLLTVKVSAQRTYTASLAGGPITVQNNDTLIICEGDSVRFNSPSAISHLWHFGGAIYGASAGPGAYVFLRPFNRPGIFNGFIDRGLLRTVFVIQVVPALGITPTNQTICRGSKPPTVQLVGLGLQDSVVWSSPNVIPSAFPRIWRVNLPMSTGTYTYTATVYRKKIVNGQTFRICDQPLTVNFDVVNSPNFTINGAGTIVCPNDSVTLNVTPAPHIGSVEWSTSRRFNSIIGRGSSIRVVSPTPRRYFAKVISNSGCVSIESANINLRSAAPTPTIIASQPVLYLGDTLYLSNGTPTGYGATWEYPDRSFRAGTGSNDSVVIRINSINQSGWYALKNNGWAGTCSSSPERIYITVLSVNSIPPINVSDEDTIVVCRGDTALLRTTLSSLGVPYTWNFAGAAPDTTIANPIAQVVFDRLGFYRGANVTDITSMKHDFAILVVDPPTTMASTVTSPVCGGDTVELVIHSSQPTDSIKWDPLVHTTLRADSAWVVLPQLINPPLSQRYQVALREQHIEGSSVFYGCPMVDTLEVAYALSYRTGIQRTTAARQVCYGGTAIIRAITSMGRQPDSIIWYSDFMRTNRIGIGDSLLWHDLHQDTIVYMEAKGSTACTVLDSFHIRVSSNINFSLNNSLVNGCVGDSINLMVSSIPIVNFLYEWSTSPVFDTIIGTMVNQSVRLRSNVPRYYVRVRNVFNLNSCKVDTIGVKFNPFVTPVPRVFANQVTDSIVLQLGDTLVLQNGQTASYGTNWTGPGLTRLGVNNSFQDSVQTRLLVSAQRGWYMGQNVASSGQCPSLPDSVHLTIRPAPALNVMVQGNSTLCLGESTTLQIQRTGGIAPFSYRWDTSATFSSSLLTTTAAWTVSPTTTTVYHYQVTDYFGNSTTGSVQVTVVPDAGLDLVLGSNETCFPVGAPITLVATTRFIPYTDIVQYDWDSTLIFSSSVDTSTAQGDSTYQVQFRGNLPQGEYWYYVRITDNNGCQYIDSLFFKIGDSLATTMISGTRQLCVGNNIVLVPNSNIRLVNREYWLSPNNDILLSPLLRIPTDSSHYLMGQWSYIQNGTSICPDTTLVNLDLDRINLGVGLPSVVPSVCYGGAAFVQANTLVNNNTALSSYHWLDPQGGTLALGMDRITRSNLFSNDTVYLEVTTNAPFNCTYQVDTLEIVVGTPGPPPLITTNDSLLCIGNTLLLTTPAAAATTFYWQHPDGTVLVTTDSFYQDTSVNLSDSGTYRLWSSSGQSCISDTTEMPIEVNQRPARPIVTPSGTVQFCHNDTLELMGLSTGCDVVFWRAPDRRRIDDDSLTNHRLSIPSIVPNQDIGLWYLVCLDTTTTCRRRSNPINVRLHPRVGRPSNLWSVSPICYGDTGVFEISNAHLAYWYADTTSGRAMATLESWVIPNLRQDTIGYVRRRDNTTGCYSDYVADTIETFSAIHAPISDTTITVCYKASLSLSFSSIVGLNYQWSGPNNYQNSTNVLNISTVDSSATGIYTVFAWDPVNSCFSDTAKITVAFYARSQPIIDTAVNVCFGDPVHFGWSNGGTCDSLQWHRGAPWRNTIFQPVSYYQDSVTLTQGSAAYQSGVSFWYLECINTTTGCVDTSNQVRVVIEDSLNYYTTGALPIRICEGDTVDLAIQNPYRRYYSYFYDYVWYADLNGTIPIDTGYNVRVPNITSDTTFYLIVSTTFGTCRSNPIPTPVTLTQPSPPILQGDALVCVGDTIRLLTLPQGIGTMYRWNSTRWSNDSTNNNNVFLVTDSATLTSIDYYTLQTRRPGGCWSERDTLYVQVAPIPNTLNITVVDTSICENEPIVLRSNGRCRSYEWVSNFGDTVMTTVNSLVLNAGLSGYQSGVVWKVRCVNSIGCTGSFSLPSPVISISSLPVIDSIRVINGPTLCVGDSAKAVGYSPSILTTGGTWNSNASGTGYPLSNTSTLAWSSNQGFTAYFVVQNIATGCLNVDSVEFTTNPLPTQPTITGDTVLCAGDDLSLAVNNTSVGYSWEGPNGFTNNAALWTLPNATNNASGWYVARVQNSLNCWSPPDSLWVTVNPVPTAGVSALRQTFCEGDTATLSATPSGGGGSYTYQWYKNTPLGTASVGNGALLVLTNIQASQMGSYYVVVRQGNCADTASQVQIQVTVPPLRFSAQAMADTVLCGGDSILLIAQGNYLTTSFIDGVWTNANGVPMDSINVLNIQIDSLTIGRQTFYWSLSSGACIDYSIDTVTIDFVPLSGDLADAGQDVVLCNRNTIILDAEPDNFSGTWRQITGPNTAGILQRTDPNTLINGLQPGNYEFVWDMIHPVCGSYDSDTVLIEVILPPNISANAGVNTYVCNPDDLRLAAVSPNDSLSYGEWTTNSGALIQNSTSAVTMVTGVPSGQTIFIWTLSTNNCPDYSRDTIEVWQTSEMVLANPDVVLINTNGSVLFNVVDNDLIPPFWEVELVTLPDAGQIFDSGNGVLSIDMEGVSENQQLIYELCDTFCPNNCDTALVSIIVDASVWCAIPNIFTPNGDGVNDHFEIPCIQPIEVLRLLIFNRWGDMVYQTDHYQNEWDGTHKGKPLPEGTYFYVLYRTNQEPKQGSVEIKR